MFALSNRFTRTCAIDGKSRARAGFVLTAMAGLLDLGLCGEKAEEMSEDGIWSSVKSYEIPPTGVAA